MKIICGTDFSRQANAAALAAAALAARTQLTLKLVHVFDPSRYVNPTKELMDQLHAGRQRKLDLLVERVKLGAAKVEARIVEGSPASTLAEMAARMRADMIVVSAAGQIAPTKWFAGSVADEVVQNSSIPTLVLRDASAFQAWAQDERPLKVLVGYDFSASADAALHWIRSLRTMVACELKIVYVASGANERARLGTAPPASPFYYPSGIRKFLEKELKHKCDLVLGENAAEICVRADWGRPDSHLIEIAAEDGADLVVVGTSQRRGLARLGSISRSVTHYAHLNVLCVPPPRVESVAPSKLIQFERVLVPVDFTARAEEAIEFAYASVRGGGQVRLVHVTAPTHRRGIAASRNGNGQDGINELSSRLESLIPKTAASRGITTQSEVLEHRTPATAICQAAERFDADLVCLGSRGRPRYREALFGSVAQAVLEQSKRAVLVFRKDGRRAAREVTKRELMKCGG
jgi:nucleotide-binding universal stress UspA family protein